MKYIKIFEQFEDEEESWWDKESEFDTIKDLKVAQHLASKNFYLARFINDKNFKTYDDDEHIYGIDGFNINPDYSPYTMICIFDYIKLNVNKILFKDLPKEIKDRLI